MFGPGDTGSTNARPARCTVEHPFGAIKGWMGRTHFLTRRLKNVPTEMGLNVMAYNIRRVISPISIRRLMQAILA